MIFEFINPSDPYHFEAPDLEIATAVTTIVGSGRAGAHWVLEDSIRVPMFIFGNSVDDWCQDKFGYDFHELAERVKGERKQEFIDALDSFNIGSLSEYKEYREKIKTIEDPKERIKYRNAYHKKKVTSLSDFGTYAWACARALEKP